MSNLSLPPRKKLPLISRTPEESNYIQDSNLLAKNSDIYSNSEYIRMVMQAIYLSLISNEEQPNMYSLHYRFKSPASLLAKEKRHIPGARKYFDENQQFHMDMKKIYDVVAMKVVIDPSTSKNAPDLPEFSKQLHRYDSNIKFINSIPEPPEPSEKDCKANKEYYIEYSKLLLNKFIKLCDPKETNLIENYNAKIDILNKLNKSSTLNIENLSTYFERLKRIFGIISKNELYLAVLTKHFQEHLDSPLLQSLGVSLNNEKPIKIKRTENGYESNFVYIDTLLGTFECQLQTLQQYNFGNNGFASHNKMEGKQFPIIKIPEDNSKPEIDKFYSDLAYISPKFYKISHQKEDTSNNIFQQYSLATCYLKLMSDVNLKEEYIEELVKLKQSDNNKNKEESFTESDVIEYINSPQFKKFKSTFQKPTNSGIMHSSQGEER